MKRFLNKIYHFLIQICLILYLSNVIQIFNAIFYASIDILIVTATILGNI